MATSVRNQWMLVMTTTTLAAASPGQGVDSVAALLEAADALYRVGWPTHAWTVLQTGVEPLMELDRLADAALLLGALEGSNVVPFATHVTPSALLERLETDQQVAVQRDIGRELTLAQLLQALRSDAP